MKDIYEIDVLENINQAGDVTSIELSIVFLRCIGALSSAINLSFLMFSSHIGWGLLMKESICSHKGRFFPLRANSFRGGLRLHVSNRKVWKISMVDKNGGVSMHLSIDSFGP